MSEGALLSEKERFDVAISVIEGDRTKYLEVIKEIDKQAFQSSLPDGTPVKEMLNEKRSVLAIVEDSETKQTVGYALATATNKPQTAHYIANAILPKFQGKRIVEKLSSAVEEELRQKGFLFYTRDTRVSGGYADTVRKAYGPRILKEEKSVNSLGEYVEFTIQL